MSHSVAFILQYQELIVANPGVGWGGVGGEAWSTAIPRSIIMISNKPLVKSAYQKINFLISQPKHML